MSAEPGAHVPASPARLPGELWGLTAWFNPSGYASKLRNLRRFADGVRRQGLKLLVVELAFGDAPFAVDESLCDRVVRVRGETVMWQKERLLNLGLRALPARCDKVAWLDGDLVFENQDWVAETGRLLESYKVVQPFSTAAWLPAGVDPEDAPPLAPGLGEGRSMPGMAHAMWHRSDWRRALSSYFEHGHTGFAWAARRALLDEHGLYDRLILGNGDFAIAHCLYGDEDYFRGLHWQCRSLSRKQHAHLAGWGRRLFADVGASVAPVPGRVWHLWHGSERDRRYEERLERLRAADFDPEADLALDGAGLWRWSSDKPALHDFVERYFGERREDG